MNQLSLKLFRRGADFLGCRMPFLCGAMTWVSEPKLVAAVCNAGGFASLAGGNAPVDVLLKQIGETRNLTAKPFAVNLITLAPAYKDQLAAVAKGHCPEAGVSHIVFAGGLPRADDIKMAKDAGVKVLCFAPTESLARMMLRNGADALIIEGMEAGGHIGLLSTMVLLQEVLFAHGGSVPVFVAGGVATGRMCAHLFLMGAAGVQMGTLFAMSEECCAHENFKKAYVQAAGRDAVATPNMDPRFQVPSVRALKNKGLEDFNKLQLELIKRMDAGEVDKHTAQMELENFWMGALRRAVTEGDVERGSLMAGQSVGLINAVRPVKEILETLVTDMEAELQRMKEFF